MAEDDAAPKRKKMSDEELLTLIANYEKAAMGSPVAAGATISTTVAPGQQAMTTLEIDRYNALNMYFARPLGNEVENQSQIVIPELRDTVEWLMPQFMRMFVASKHVCRFDAEGPNDEDQALLETEAVNHVFMNMNNGVQILHDFFKDALLLRNGYSKVYYDTHKKTTVERYTQVAQQELPNVLKEGEDEVEVLEQREYQVALPGQQQPVTVFDLKVRRTGERGKVCVQCIPSEEVLVSPRARSTNVDEEVPYVCHKTNRTRSDLIGDGHDADWVNSLSAGRPNWLEIDALARNEVTDQMSVENPSDHAMQEIEVREVTIRVDFDGDGIAELRRVLVAGDKVGDNEEIEESPIASCVPMRMPHRHTGISLYDLLADLQVLKTTLFRQGMNNLSLANNIRIGVDWRNCNIDDLLTSRPGGAIRTNGPPGNVLMPIEQPSNLIEQVLPAIEYVDSMREMRTGVGRETMGLDMDALQDVTKAGQLAGMAAASLKIELMARMLAEGVKDLFLKIRSCLIRHQDQELQFQMAGKWVSVNPSEWGDRTRVTPTVGLGSGNRMEARGNIAMLAQAQGALQQYGLVGPKQAYASFKQLAEILGYDSPERFAMDPDSPEYAQHQQQMAANPPPPAPQVQVAQIRAQIDKQKLAVQQQDSQLEYKRDMLQSQAEIADARQKAQAEIAHAALEAHQDRTADMATAAAGHDADKRGQDMQLLETYIKAFAQIIAAKMKIDASADEAAEMRRDVDSTK